MATNQQYQSIPKDDRAVRPSEAARYLGISRSTLYELIARGLLEAPFPLGVRAVGWRHSTLDAYLERRAAQHQTIITARAAKREAKQSRLE
jgi:prophage regulatory protein